MLQWPRTFCWLYPWKILSLPSCSTALGTKSLTPGPVEDIFPNRAHTWAEQLQGQWQWQCQRRIQGLPQEQLLRKAQWQFSSFQLGNRLLRRNLTSWILSKRTQQQQIDWVWTQGFMLAKQMVYCLSHASNLPSSFNMWHVGDSKMVARGRKQKACLLK
jgi:hypothetical protein